MKAKVGTRVCFQCCGKWEIGEVVEVIRHKDLTPMQQKFYGTEGVSYRCETDSWKKQTGNGASAICRAKDIQVWQ
jgi:hypothetical protein